MQMRLRAFDVFSGGSCPIASNRSGLLAAPRDGDGPCGVTSKLALTATIHLCIPSRSRAQLRAAVSAVRLSSAQIAGVYTRRRRDAGPFSRMRSSRRSLEWSHARLESRWAAGPKACVAARSLTRREAGCAAARSPGRLDLVSIFDFSRQTLVYGPADRPSSGLAPLVHQMTNVREDATIPAQEPLRGRPQHLPHQRADRGRRAVQARAAGLTP